MYWTLLIEGGESRSEPKSKFFLFIFFFNLKVHETITLCVKEKTHLNREIQL